MFQSKIVLLAVLISLPVFADLPVETLIPVENIYTPLGFDSNDNTEVIIEGYLPNLCHKFPQVNAQINGNQVDLTVNAFKYDEASPYCPQMVVPFVKAVSLGVLKEGTYTIIVNRGTALEDRATIKVAQAKRETVDDFLYAHVEFIQTIPGTRMIALHGYQPSDCLEFEEIEYTSNGKDTYALLPKMRQVSNYCPMKRTPFYAEWEVPNEIRRGKVLLHVRRMSGESVNLLYY